MSPTSSKTSSSHEAAGHRADAGAAVSLARHRVLYGRGEVGALEGEAFVEQPLGDGAPAGEREHRAEPEYWGATWVSHA